jgi:2'-5' RNA ligase
MPAEPVHRFFQDLINDLTRRYDAPVFEPHVTIYVGADSTDAVDATLSNAARDCEPIVLQALEVSHSDEFIKTLFVEFGQNSKLRQLNQVIRGAAQNSSDYDLKPHLSLLYKRMSVQTRRRLARSIEVPFSQVVFDSLKAVRCVSPTQSRADVEAWHVVRAKVLGS